MARTKSSNRVLPPEPAPPDELHVESVTWGDLTWINIEAPREAEIQYLADNYHFHPLALDDCISRKQLPKLDVYQGYLFFVFHFPFYDKETRISSKRQWSAFIGDGYIITLSTGELRTLNALFRDCQANEDARQEYFVNGSGFLIYRILDRTIDSYFPVLDKILSLIEDVEDDVFDEEIEATKELSIIRRDIITQRAVMFPTRTVFIEMENKLKRFSKTDVTTYYNDLMDHMNKICETLDEVQEIIEVFKDSDTTLATYRVNDILRVLTILASFYGMNIPLPGGSNPGGSPHTWWILLAIMFVIMGAMLVYFRKKRFL
jgi:magnesium transporter